MCAEQTQSPSITMPEPQAPLIIQTNTNNNNNNNNTDSPTVPFRIQRTTGIKPRRNTGLPPKRLPKLGLPRSLARIRRLIDSQKSHGAKEPTPDRKYLSKKKQQAVQALQLYRGEATTPPPAEVMRKLREAWLHAVAQPTPALTLLHLLKQLHLKRYYPDLNYLLKQLSQPISATIDSTIESTLLVDLDRVLRLYLKNETRQPESSKRRPLDCSYLVYQLLRHQHVTVYPEQVVCRDRDYHNSVYEGLATELELSYWPLEVNDSSADVA